jgi:hypothetical protein
MKRHIAIWKVASFVGAFNMASTALNVAFVANVPVLPALRIPLFIAITINLIAIAILSNFSTVNVTNSNSHSLGSKLSPRQSFIGGAVVAVASLIVLHQSPATVLRGWFALWGTSGTLQIIFVLLVRFMGQERSENTTDQSSGPGHQQIPLNQHLRLTTNHLH